VDYLWVGLGGFAGANARYILSDAIRARLGLDFPSGTFVINLTGSLLIGILVTLLTERLIVDPVWRRLLVVGFLGGYTTFSSYTYEALALVEQGRWASAALYLLGSNGLGLLACGAGIALARTIGA
jgi:CrcB protein